MNNNKVENKKTTTKRKSTNRINTNKVKVTKKVKEVEKDVVEEVSIKENNSTSFNLIEVIIIMIITAVFGILIGSCVTYFKDKVIEGNDVPDGFEEFLSVYDELVDEYYTNVDEKKLIEAGIEGMVEYLGDPFSSYLNSNETSSLNEELEGEFVGMGATVSMNDNNQIYIYDLFEDGPAAKAGFKVGDIIIKVDGVSVDNKTTEEVSYEIKGQEGTKVEITILRDNEEKTLTLTRGRVVIPSVSYKIIDNTKVGYIDISVFAKNTTGQFKNAMDEMIKDGITSVIIDVRDNTGGYLSTAEEIASMFLKKDSVIYQLDTKGKIEEVKTVNDGEYDIPVAILTNGVSASSSEVLAASISENLNAPIIGEKTYGKGTVQKTKTLESGAMIKYTIQEWYTPKGNKVNGIGITPNYEVFLTEDYYANSIEANDNQLQKAVEILNK